MAATRSRGAVLAALTALAIVALAPGAQAATMVRGHSGPLTASLTPDTQAPKAGASWPLSVSASLHGRPARASAVYQFVFSGVVVSTDYPGGDQHFRFRGRFHDTLVFPPAAVGQPLTLRVVVRAAGRTVTLSWPLTAQR